ncbi:MAG: MFS transporter [Cellulophaga sp.]|nr:MFS transporter [Cellulophaga sp.]
MKPKPHILPLLVIAQFACTSLWFAGNAIVDDLSLKIGLADGDMGYILSSVQFGFIIGTLLFALLLIADRFSPSKVFFICAILGALCNFSLLVENLTKEIIFFARFGTGFFLAGIYPIGMKIAADYYDTRLGKVLGLLVGALVLGTAFPFLLTALDINTDYTGIIKTTSLLAVLGGCMILFFVPNGPYRKSSKKLQLKAGLLLFKHASFKKAAIGYFGHMWELYAFWAFTPLAIKTFNDINSTFFSIPLWTFIVITCGALACVLGGLFSIRVGSYKVAFVSLLVSGIFCLISPALFLVSPMIFLVSWCMWGMAVAADSPQFSSLVANAAPVALKGTGLTLVTCIGFALSIVSIQLLSFLALSMNPTLIFLFLSLGPILGLYHLKNK